MAVGDAGIQGKTEGEYESEVPFMAQEERRPLNRVRKTMQLHDVDSRLRDMRYAANATLRRPLPPSCSPPLASQGATGNTIVHYLC